MDAASSRDVCLSTDKCRHACGWFKLSKHTGKLSVSETSDKVVVMAKFECLGLNLPICNPNVL